MHSPAASAAALAFALILAWPGASAHARAEDAPSIAVSGFGTLGAVRHDSDGVEFRRDISAPNGARAHRWSFDPDSMLGVQATARFGEPLEATLQLVSRHGIGTGYNPQVTWAFVKWKPREDVAVRAGRLGIDLYMQGDAAEIGYANLLVRQPLIFYPRLFDGADAEWTTPLGAGTLRLKAQAGRTIGKLVSNGSPPYDTKGSRGRIFLAEYARGAWTGRISAGRLTLKEDASDANTRLLFGGLAATPRGAEIRAAISLKNRPMDYATAGLAYDEGPVQALASHSRISTPHAPDLRAFYVQAGYRIGKFTPYASHTRQRTQRELIPTGVPWGLSAPTDALNQGALVAQTAMWANQSIVALGVRYDMSHNTALKLQADRIRYQDPWSVADPGLLTGDVAARGFKGMTLISAALEFVF